MLLDGSLEAAERILAIVAGLLMIAMALQFFGLQAFHRLTVGFASSTFATSLRNGPQSRGAARVWRIQRLLAVPVGLCLCRRSREHQPSTHRVSHHGVVWARNLPCDARDGRHRAGSCAGLRRRGVWFAGSCILLLGIITLGRGFLPFGAHMPHGRFGGHPA